MPHTYDLGQAKFGSRWIISRNFASIKALKTCQEPSSIHNIKRSFLLLLRAIKMFSTTVSLFRRVLKSDPLTERSPSAEKGKVSALFMIHFVDRPAEHREIIVALSALNYSSFDTNWSDFYSGPITRSLLYLSHFRSCAELRMEKNAKSYVETIKVIDRLWNWVDVWAETLRASCLSSRLFKSLFEIANRLMPWIPFDVANPWINICRNNLRWTFRSAHANARSSAASVDRPLCH